AQATGASVENLNLLNAGDIDLALVQNDTADYAKKGEMFFKAPLKNVVAICRIYPEHIQVAVNPESGITSLAEFKDHKVSIGAPGSGNEANARQILGELGLFNGEKYEGFEPHFLSYAETTSNFKDRLIDGFMFTTGAPNSGIQEIVTAQPLRFIPIDGELRDKIIAKYPFFAPAVIEKGTYSGLTSDVQTIAVQACLVARRDMSDDEAYALTKAIFENLEALGNAHAKGKSLTLAHALDGMTLDIHPGALKYYKEVGLVK
ncbi:MAG: TAXI family TRAP transporter solute-binding subunit, partial [Pyramidobacter sp.]|nr:TAXI family TRAP transporter solute-binding subunit [Pyramidobacter sp.]